MPRITLGLMISVWIAIPLSAQLEVTTTGVGIGTTSPTGKLEIAGVAPSFGQDAIRISAGTSTNVSGLRLVGGTSGTSDIVHLANTDGGVYAGWLRLFADGVEKARINASSSYPSFVNAGNFGIGTSSPGKKFEVVGEIVGRNSSSAGGAATSLQTTSSGLTVWLNSNYDPSSPGSNWGTAMTLVAATGNVGIGTTSPANKLQVSGSVRASSFISDTATYADFVFKPGYRLAPLSEVEAHIATKGHLPDIPSEAEAKANGIDLAAMQVKLLQKVEELTLHLIELKKENDLQRAEIDALKAGRGALPVLPPDLEPSS